MPEGTDGNLHVIVRDLRAGVAEVTSLGPGGVPGNDASFFPGVSLGGRYIAFVSEATNLVPGDTNAVRDVFVCNRRTGTTRRASVGLNGAQANQPSGFSPGAVPISAGGRVVAFDSEASNLVPGDANGSSDVFARVLHRGR